MTARAAAIQRVFLGLLSANLAVVGAKAVIGLTTGSLSVLGDAVHSSVDALNNVLFLVLIGYAQRAPDDDHPYGHAKFEVLGAVLILVFLSVACFELLKGAVTSFLHARRPPQLSPLDFALLLITLFLNLWVAWYEDRKGRQLESDLLRADAAHTRVDVLITTSVIAGGLLSRRGIPYVDPALAVVITLLIAHAGWQVVRRALPVMVDEVARAPEAIRGVAEAVAGVESAYAIRSRGAGATTFAELTIGVSGELAVERAHDIADAVEQQLKRELALNEVVVHVEPC